MMRKSRQIILTLVLTILLVGVAWFAGRGKAMTPVVTVFVAGRPIPAGTRLTATDLKPVAISADLMIDTYLMDPTQAEGLSTPVDLSLGEILNRSRLTSFPVGLTYPDVAPGRRLMTIELPAVDANGFWLASGSLVDLFLIPKNRDLVGGIHVLERIKIVALLDGTTGGPIQATANQSRSASAPLLCLDLTIEQAQVIANSSGLYNLMLAAVTDTAHEQRQTTS